jgi:N-acetylglucosamine kinase-like BadF-type ATPase
MESNETTSDAETHNVPRYTELQALVAKMAPDFEKFYKDGNKAAGTRVRNAMQELKTFAQAVRTEVQAIKNGGEGGDAKEGAAEEAGD